MRAYTILVAVVTYVSVCLCQVSFEEDPPAAAGNQQDGTADRLGLVGSIIGVAPVPNAPGNLPSVPGTTPRPAGCFCHPGNQKCPPGTQRGSQLSQSGAIGDRIANTGGNDCPGQIICCSNAPRGVNPPTPCSDCGPIIQQDCGVREVQTRNPNPLEASIGEFPWMTLVLEQNNNFIGSGALISDDWVLTAAHKVLQYRGSPQSLKIRVGDHDLSSPVDNPQFPHVEVTVQQIIIHPQFDSIRLLNNVALLRLSHPVNHRGSRHIERVCLPEQGQLFSSQRCWVSGWGEKAFSGGSVGNTAGGILKRVDVPIWDSFACEAQLQTTRLGAGFDLDTNSFVCAGGEPGKDSCSGDGGAPLVCEGSDGRFAVVGLVAWGVGCAMQNIPGVYVNVPNYADFIRQNTGI
ncbi:unnamed protein product [Meganyctiphanes norvegica]|uniref:Peptidase S1 domain-containing protein n=1 Tax=Meganyctiphanes norvegica TaxID=48144 RepID=A0AAV2R5G4_MEGNR